jgi:hypothetical protein
MVAYVIKRIVIPAGDKGLVKPLMQFKVEDFKAQLLRSDNFTVAAGKSDGVGCGQKIATQF